MSGTEAKKRCTHCHERSSSDRCLACGAALPPSIQKKKSSALTYDDLEFFDYDGESVAVVMCNGEKPALIRDDDLVSFSWDTSWGKPNEWVYNWENFPAVILRRRPFYEDRMTRYYLDANGNRALPGVILWRK